MGKSLEMVLIAKNALLVGSGVTDIAGGGGAENVLKGQAELSLGESRAWGRTQRRSDKKRTGLAGRSFEST